MTNTNLNESQCWQAVLDRDRRFDGRFVLAVRTTGIYCRPSCPARRPLRRNIVFYGGCEDAEKAGYRACKRCQPNAQAYEAELVQRVCEFVNEHLHERLTLTNLGAQVGVSPQHLQRVFKHVMGISPREYIDARRLELLKSRLKEGDAVTRALYDSGYSSSSRLYERAPDQLGMTPTVYQKGGKGMLIHYTIVESTLGFVLVAATERGICAVSLDDAPEHLEAELCADYPAADIVNNDADLGEWVQAVLSSIDGQPPYEELPLDVRATAFQRRVWQELRAIPLGETRTYSQIAAAIGSPKAARAVGSACANNRVSLIVPCHRAVREDGGLGGYRWGLARKERLLAREKAEREKQIPQTA